MADNLDLLESSYKNCTEAGWSQQASSFKLQKANLNLTDTAECQEETEISDNVRGIPGEA